MTDMIVDVMAEFLSVLAIVTVEIKRRPRSQFITSIFWALTHVFLEKFLKKLLDRNDVKYSLQMLERVTWEVARMLTSTHDDH